MLDTHFIVDLCAYSSPYQFGGGIASYSMIEVGPAKLKPLESRHLCCEHCPTQISLKTAVTVERCDFRSDFEKKVDKKVKLGLSGLSGLPDAVYSYQKSRFGSNFEGLGRQNVGIFSDHLVHFVLFGVFYPYWYIEP
jgi:hypothetical protein